MEGLIGALKIIKEECEKHGNCDECPLRHSYDNSSNTRCEVNYCPPYKWKLKDDPDVVPRLFV